MIRYPPRPRFEVTRSNRGTYPLVLAFGFLLEKRKRSTNRSAPPHTHGFAVKSQTLNRLQWSVNWKERWRVRAAAHR
jgi:hypothetical protein